MSKPIWMWALFLSIVVLLLVIDLGLFHRTDREIGVKESLWMSAFYIVIALCFGGWIWWQIGFQDFAEYTTGYLVEKSLALDNIFLISVIFTSLSIPRKYQHRVLFWGILGVIVLRGIMIGLGAHLIAQFSWILYIFAVFMIFTGIKMMFVPEKMIDIDKNPLLIWMRGHLRITKKIEDHDFIKYQVDPVTRKKELYITPLLVALIMIEITDVIFAVDSVPAIFTITQDPYIVYTSNIFAILGLRALYFALAAIVDKFYYLKYALALVLIFIGSKIFITDLLGIEKMHPAISLSVTVGLIAFGCIYSIYHPRKKDS